MDLSAETVDAMAAGYETRKLERLTELRGVDVPVATAFLQFLEPERYSVMSDREWSALRTYGELSQSYPTAPGPAAYDRYLETCRTVADWCGWDLQTLYRAL
ncbi:hypothetical protein CV102_23010 [Natronococcus pandeyae]|uniref:Uncharacterized protein n=2 Tax=Natronococcus pandeyae TaxID=2055836 RepID=A0A8J8PYW1_9EURY|nr:hypothetical protein CV102_23010 [Natronococcus pandeyae]